MNVLLAFGATEAGSGRTCQDAFVIDCDRGWFAVADGLGGRVGGDVASRTALDAFAREARERLGANDDAEAAQPRETLVQAIRAGQDALIERGGREPELAGMGTTLVACIIQGDQLHVGHVGDSRAYLLRGSSIRQLTEDHSLANALVSQGRLTESEARVHPRGRVLVQALGQEAMPHVDLSRHSLETGDSVLLCSDGVTEGVEESSILALKVEHPAIAERCAALIRRARDGGSQDDATVVWIDLGTGGPSWTSSPR